MRAARLHQRGGPEQIVVEDAPVPEPRRGEVRLRVAATAITPGELTWDQTYTHEDGSSRLPSIPGHDVAGTIDLLGPEVTDLEVGEAVYALIDFPLNGAAAEFVVIPAGDVARAPKSVSANVAAAIPLSGLTAWQGLFDHGKLEAGQKVLIHGGAGGVGAFAVQMARSKRAHVITTASPKNIGPARELGAAEVVDYTTTRFEDAVRDVDLVFDTVGGDTLRRSFDVVRRGGTIVSIAGKPDAARAGAAGIHAAFFIVRPRRLQLQRIADMVEAGELRVNVQEAFWLSQAKEAFARSVSGHLNGKIVIRIE